MCHLFCTDISEVQKQSPPIFIVFILRTIAVTLDIRFCVLCVCVFLKLLPTQKTYCFVSSAPPVCVCILVVVKGKQGLTAVV